MTYVEILASYVVWLWRIIVIIGFVTLFTGWGKDDIDPPGEWGRSGMSLYIDAGTGCQYLSHWSGLTPRLNGAGKQMGCRS